ncbi:MAG TPA: hypothetical protein VFG51_02060 [Candidatus Saccharimonadia bacterium]|nr:hypothetical protein [Candidatus Saccharimonadia bacterium]
MPNTPPLLAVLYIESQRMGLYKGGDQILWADLPENIVKNSEVVSKPELNTLIRNLAGTSTAPESMLIVIFSETIVFEKNFAVLPPDQKEAQTQAFFDLIPFERTLTRVYPFEGGSKAIAINRDFYESIRDAFGQIGFQTLAVVPGHVMTMMGFNTFDVGTAKQILKKSETTKQQTMVYIRQPILTSEEKEVELAKKHTPLIMLIFVGVLILVIGLTFLILRLEAPAPKKPAQKSPASVSAQPSILPSPSSSIAP